MPAMASAVMSVRTTSISSGASITACDRRLDSQARPAVESTYCAPTCCMAAPSSRAAVSSSTSSFAPGFSMISRYSWECRRLCADSKCSSRVNALFGIKMGTDSKEAGIYGSQMRDDFSSSDVEHYFEYMGELAVEGDYTRLKALLDSGVHPADCLILLASQEGDVPKIKELMAAGADIYAKDLEGRNSLDRAQDDDVRKLLLDLAEEQKNSPAMP